ncbi:glycoside hydrolase family 16 protein [Hymenobacter sp. BT175]|uniref:glycoside hydrolase family 16 protein n=1 Tax=Hymenobacter translucens TaxID=2886507 RepID=UPI001D0DD323|nr:glycoside hydrolase family 16 protein [Hymenobacter translucens]MCC2545580.1 glycoside hydrolase family 16 protein [Hymenobacter translucens]
MIQSAFTRLLFVSVLLGGCTSEAPRPTVTVTPPKGPGTYTFTELAWSDEFNQPGQPDPQQWTYEVGGSGWGNNELQYYTQNRRENARVENGNLVIEARREASNGRDYTSARVNSRAGAGSQTYGRFEVRAQVPGGRGTWPAIWMMPDQSPYGNRGWPDNGEIDIMEHVGYDPGVVHASTHCNRYYFKVGNQKTGTVRVPDFDTAFHVYAMEWTPESISCEVDGQVYFVTRNEKTGWQAWPWDQPFHFIFNIAVGGDWGGARGVDPGVFPKQLLIDYVRVYRMKAE